jgi:predicted lipid-binding transport protein (Tim44 family)
MGNGFQFLDIVLFAAVAAFFVLRLRSVLGKRTGHQEPPPSRDAFSSSRREGEREEPEAEPEAEKVIPLPDRRDEAAEPEPAGREAPAGAAEGLPGAGLARIKMADKAFDENQFLAGAKQAFEMIVAAYAEGDTKALRPLLANDVYSDFAGAIEERRKNDQTLETTLVGINEADIVDAELQGRTAFVKVRFRSEQVNTLRDSEGRIVEGDPNAVTKVTDIWTFARNTRSRDPNWTLVATESPD